MKSCEMCGSKDFRDKSRPSDDANFLCDVHYWKYEAFKRGEALRLLIEALGLDYVLTEPLGLSPDNIACIYDLYFQIQKEWDEL